MASAVTDLFFFFLFFQFFFFSLARYAREQTLIALVFLIIAAVEVAIPLTGIVMGSSRINR